MNWTLIGFIFVSAFLLPWVIRKYNLKDDMKFKKTLPIGSARFKAFLIALGWFLLIILGLGLIFSLFE